jgi:lysozyme family protein
MKGLPVQHVKFITEQEVADIYKDSYWDACRCGEMTYGIDYMTFDPAVNSGPRRGIKWMQRALRVKADGVVGPKTLAAIADLSPEEEIAVIDRAADLRMGFLRSLRHWPTFGKGWSRRVMETEAQAKLDAPLDNDTIASLPRTRPSIWDFIMNLLDTLFNKEDLVS